MIVFLISISSVIGLIILLFGIGFKKIFYTYQLTNGKYKWMYKKGFFMKYYCLFEYNTIEEAEESLQIFKTVEKEKIKKETLKIFLDKT